MFDAKSDSQPLTEAGGELTRRMLAEAREEVTRADSKAQILLAATGVAVSVVTGAIIGGEWSPAELAGWACAAWWTGAVTVGGAVATLGHGIYPKLKRTGEDRLAYFEDVYKLKDDSLASVVGDINHEAQIGHRDVEQLRQLSRIAHHKYVAVQRAEWALAGATTLLLAAALAG